MSIESAADWKGLRRVARVVRLTLDALERNVAPGITTRELDAVAAGVFQDHRARSAPAIVYGFPGTVLISINDEVVHGIPGNRKLRGGDVVKLDVTAELDGYVADAARTVVVPPADPESVTLQRCASDAFDAALVEARAGRKVNAIGRAVQSTVSRAGFRVIHGLDGHGVGRTIHEPPTVPNWFNPLQRDVLSDGLVLTIEPIITAGNGSVETASDGWTVRTRDGGMAAHHEHTIVITSGAPVVLTAEC